MKKLIRLCLIILLLLGMGQPTATAGTIPAVGQTLPEFELPVPKESAERQYLELSGLLSKVGIGSFRLSQIGAPVLVVQIFSMYCPHCQKDAPNMNAFFHKVESDPKARSIVRIIGIGAGNNPYEVGIFRQKYQVPFPLFPDPDYIIHKKLGEVRTPYFFVVRRGSDGVQRLIYSQLGSFGDPDRFLSMLLATGTR